MSNACCMKNGSYVQRTPRKNQYYKCVEVHFEELEGIWEEQFQYRYGYWRPHITETIYKYLDCGDLHCGFARVRCDDCNNEYLLPFSCKRRYFCPSCHQKRVIEFSEHLTEKVLEEVPHRQWVFSIPKRIRVFFMYDRKLLAKLSKCVWKVLSEYLKQTVNDDNAVPAAVIAVQTFGDFLNFNSHFHIIASDGCFDKEGNFIIGKTPSADDLEEAFRYEVLKMLKKEGKLFDITIENMKTWHHSGFNIYCGLPVYDDREGIINLAEYIIRAPISQERMYYIPAEETDDGIAKVVYKSKNSSSKETVPAIDFLAKLVIHIPNKGEQLVRYYGYYSNKTRGLRKKADSIDQVSNVIETDISKKQFRKNWARLIQKIYNVDPLCCPKCSGKMRIIAFIEDKVLIRKILKHLDLWMPCNNSPPKKSVTYAHNDWCQDYESQIEYEDNYSQINPYDEF
jgi:hypothetical protein